MAVAVRAFSSVLRPFSLCSYGHEGSPHPSKQGMLSGWDVLEALKPLEGHLLGRCAFYMLTSSLSPTDSAQARQNPLVVGFLHKPLDGPEIQAMQARQVA